MFSKKRFSIYEWLGCHRIAKGYVFRVWAPRATAVFLCGDFNGWDRQSLPMSNIGDGVWEVITDTPREYDAYKYYIVSQNGNGVLKSDPYAYHFETRPATASKVYSLTGYDWKDTEWQRKKAAVNAVDSPLNIYEVHLGSWKRHADGSFLSYEELADELIPYVLDMHYTHVELMPVMEHPFDGSWGYQVTGYYAVTSRLGTPYDFMLLVDAFHAAGIGVILDWVPAHFPKDAFGLYEFDGEPLYEASQWDRKENKSWGTRRFDYGRKEVISFLISSAVFFFEKYHIDGLRVDAVASMLYLDYDKDPGEWVPNIYGENKNLEAVAFLRRLNEAVFERFPNALMIAEESTAWPKMTAPTSVGGLGFNFKWNMGWMNDILAYIKTDPIFRRFSHNKLTFSMMYAFSENYVLPISHDEVVHGKRSLIDKMPGGYEDKFAGIRAFFGYMMSHPGKKLNFMGNEFGQFKEWNYKEGVEFFLKDYPMHAKLSNMVKELNHLYKDNAPLYEIEDSWDGFEWLAADDNDRNFIAYKRKDRAGKEIVVLVNFSGEDFYGYTLGLEKGKYRVIFNTDAVKFGGRGVEKKRVYHTEKTFSHGKEYSIRFNLPKLTCVYLTKINEI